MIWNWFRGYKKKGVRSSKGPEKNGPAPHITCKPMPPPWPPSATGIRFDTKTPMPQVKPPAMPRQKFDLAVMSNDDLRRAIRETNESIASSMDEQRNSLQRHLDKLLSVEAARAGQILMDDTY